MSGILTCRLRLEIANAHFWLVSFASKNSPKASPAFPVWYSTMVDLLHIGWRLPKPRNGGSTFRLEGLLVCIHHSSNYIGMRTCRLRRLEWKLVILGMRRIPTYWSWRLDPCLYTMNSTLAYRGKESQWPMFYLPSHSIEGEYGQGADNSGFVHIWLI